MVVFICILHHMSPQIIYIVAIIKMHSSFKKNNTMSADQIIITNIPDFIVLALQCGISTHPTRLLSGFGGQTRRRSPFKRVDTGARASHRVVALSMPSVTAVMTLEQMSAYFSPIQRLSIINIQDDLVNTILLHIMEYIKNVTALDLVGCTRLEDQTVFNIAEKCTRLQFLDLQSCCSVTTQCICTVATTYNNLLLYR